MESFIVQHIYTIEVEEGAPEEWVGDEKALKYKEMDA